MGSRSHNSGKGIATEVDDPDLAAELIDLASDPFAYISRAAEACGMNKRTAQALMKRMRTKYAAVNQEIREIKTPHILKTLDEKIGLTLDYMDEYAISQASYKDMGIVLGILLEKRQLLNNMPTQIITNEERQSISVLLPALIEECGRRGFTIEAQPIRHDDEEGVSTAVLDPAIPQEPSYNKTASNMRKLARQVPLDDSA